MKTCTYISGRSCVGKSTLAQAVRQLLPEIAFVAGDDYWRTLDDALPFDTRVSRTNAAILAAVSDSDASHIVCEWVPCRGLFVAQLQELCTSVRRAFLHVGLTAPASVLRARKKERDGVDEAPDTVPVPDTQVEYDCMVFDTTKEELGAMAEAVAEWVLSHRRSGPGVERERQGFIQNGLGSGK